ncbi:MAG: GIY-YIG nuclease family protein [Bacteroidia bacterium]|nr:GIY-YIG nuclease family protein [Bacteroidia bacterium]
MSICYILYSPSLDRYYIGASQESIADRLAKHNSHYITE